MKLFLFIVAAAAIASAQQTGRTVTITWQDTRNPAGTLYDVYRSKGSCPSNTYEKIAAGLAVKTYADAAVSPGQYCYTATAVSDTIASEYAIPIAVQVKPYSPTSMGATPDVMRREGGGKK